jgi:hypothetical protein
MRDPLEELAQAMGGQVVEAESGGLIFQTGDAQVVATHQGGGSRLRIRAYLGSADEEEVVAWTARQPPPLSGMLQIVEDDVVVEPRLLFERPVQGNDWTTDVLLEEVREYSAAWGSDEVADQLRYSRTFAIEQDPRDLDPASAWLLLGDEASFPELDDVADAHARADVGIFDYLWTAAKQTVVGDLVLIYFLGRRKAVHFVARAASNAFFSADISVNAQTAVADQQWWVYLTPPVAIRPISFKALQAASNDHLILRGRSGRFLHPEVIAALPVEGSTREDKAEVERIWIEPTGIAELPQPADITVSVWRALAAGALALEAHVSRYIVTPLLSHVLAGTELTVRPEYRVGRGSADFIVLHEERPVAVIEVKLAVNVPAGGEWSKCDDYLQLRRYMDALGVPGVLVDSHRVLLVDLSESRPPQDIQRRHASDAELELIRRHITGNSEVARPSGRRG